MILSVFTVAPTSAAVIEDTSVGIESGSAADKTETEESFSVVEDSVEIASGNDSIVTPVSPSDNEEKNSDESEALSSNESDSELAQTGAEEDIAETGKSSFTYTVSNNTVTITGLSDEYLTDLVIPETIEDLPVVAIANNAFSGCSQITSITVPNSVTSIGDSAFKGTIPTKVSLPFIGKTREATGYTAVFGYVFGYIKSSNYPADTVYQYYDTRNKDYYWYYIPKTIKEVIITDANQIPLNAFYGCNWIEKLYINDINGDADVVGTDAFYNCKAMTVYVNRNTGVHTYCERNGIRHCSTKSILLEADSIVLFRNESTAIGSVVHLLNGAIDDEPETVWYSSDTSVVTVNRTTGLISSVGPGTATITADSEGVTATAEVTVYFKLESIALNKTLTQVDIGKSEQLTVIYNPENTTDSRKITWSSSDNSIVSVDADGNVTANKKGTATITAGTENGKKATCKVEVLVPISSIEFADNPVTIARGTKKKLTVSVTPSNTTDTYSWSSSDTEIATIDKYGNVTVKKVGTAVITVTTSRGKKATCTVIVNSPASSIEISKKNVSLFAGKEVTLTVALAPYDVTDSIEWTTSDSTVATVNNGIVTALSEGTATITVTAESGVYDTCEVEVVSDIDSTDIYLEYEEIEFDGEAKEPTVEVYFNNELLIQDTDYRIEYDKNTDAGEAEVTVYSLKDDTSTVRYFTITPVDLSKCDIRYKGSMVYTGSALECIEEILFNSVRLVKGADYTASYRDNTNVGNGKVSIVGKGNFTGSTLKSFAITPKSLSDASVTLSKSTFTYNGASQKPTVTVKDGGKKLTENKDYTLSFSDTVNAGTVTITITGMGNYNESTTKTYVINKKAISESDVVLEKDTLAYNGKEQKPNLTIISGSLTLTEGTDYDVTYENNTNVGTADITITAKGNFTGTIPAEFYIKYVKGDVDGDGEVNLMDASMIQRYLCMLKYKGMFIEIAADIDNDGIEVSDATWIQRYIADIEIPVDMNTFID